MRCCFVVIFVLITSLPALAAVDLSPEEIQKAYWDSYNYEKMQNYEDAIKALMPVYEAYPNGYTVNLRLGWLYYLQGHYANALHHYERAMKVLPASIEAKLGYTLPLLKQQKYREVEQMCYQILKVDFYNYYGNLRLVYVLRLLGDLQSAENVALKMLSLYPTDVAFLTEYGLIKQAQGELQEAKRIFTDVLTLDPQNITAKTQLKALQEPSGKEE